MHDFSANQNNKHQSIGPSYNITNILTLPSVLPTLTGEINERWPITINSLWGSIRISVIAVHAFCTRSAHSDYAKNVATLRFSRSFCSGIGKTQQFLCFVLPAHDHDLKLRTVNCEPHPQPALHNGVVISRPIPAISGQVFKFETDKTCFSASAFSLQR